VISVHILCLDDCFNTTIMPQPTEITQFIFGQPLSASPFPRNGCRGKLDWVNLFINVGVQYLADGIARAQLPLRGLPASTGSSMTHASG
jgi:hypothetical protein